MLIESPEFIHGEDVKSPANNKNKPIDVLPMNKFRGFFGFKQHMEAKPRL